MIAASSSRAKRTGWFPHSGTLCVTVNSLVDQAEQRLRGDLPHSPGSQAPASPRSPARVQLRRATCVRRRSIGRSSRGNQVPNKKMGLNSTISGQTWFKMAIHPSPGRFPDGNGFSTDVCVCKSLNTTGFSPRAHRDIFLQWCDRGGGQLAELPSEGPTMFTGL